MKNLNFDKFLQNYRGLEDIVPTIVDSFLQHKESLLKNLEDSITERDFIKIERAAHTIKGSVSNFYAEIIMNAAKEIEMFAKLQNLSEVQLKFKQLQPLYSSFCADLKLELENYLRKAAG